MMIGVPQYAVYLSHRYYDPSISVKNAAALAEYLIAKRLLKTRKWRPYTHSTSDARRIPKVE